MGSLATVVALVLAAALAHLGTARLLRRLLPLAALLRLTLVFPDRAPSRMAVALRANQAQHLRQRIEAGTAAREDPPSQIAADLLAIVAFLTAHDRRTRGHAERVRAYADLIAAEVGFSPAERAQLAWAALLHDVGKIGVPVEVLNKPGKLTPDELEAVRRHAAIGHCLVAPLAEWLGPFARVPLEHHEYFDGTGYPLGLAGLDISLPARIVSVADAFDVMTSTRAYRLAGGGAAARAELVRCAGTQFDPAIVRAFLNAGVDVADGRGAAVSGALSPGWMGLRWSAAAREIATRVGAAVGILSVGGAGALEPMAAGGSEAPELPTVVAAGAGASDGDGRDGARRTGGLMDEDVVSLLRADAAPGKLDPLPTGADELAAPQGPGDAGDPTPTAPGPRSTATPEPVGPSRDDDGPGAGAGGPGSPTGGPVSGLVDDLLSAVIGLPPTSLPPTSLLSTPTSLPSTPPVAPTSLLSTPTSLPSTPPVAPTSLPPTSLPSTPTQASLPPTLPVAPDGPSVAAPITTVVVAPAGDLPVALDGPGLVAPLVVAPAVDLPVALDGPGLVAPLVVAPAVDLPVSLPAVIPPLEVELPIAAVTGLGALDAEATPFDSPIVEVVSSLVETSGLDGVPAALVSSVADLLAPAPAVVVPPALAVPGGIELGLENLPLDAGAELGVGVGAGDVAVDLEGSIGDDGLAAVLGAVLGLGEREVGVGAGATVGTGVVEVGTAVELAGPLDVSAQVGATAGPSGLTASVAVTSLVDLAVEVAVGLPLAPTVALVPSSDAAVPAVDVAGVADVLELVGAVTDRLAPVVAPPELVVPEVVVPEVVVPEVVVPEVVVPQVVVPQVVVPEVVVPKAVVPELVGGLRALPEVVPSAVVVPGVALPEVVLPQLPAPAPVPAPVALPALESLPPLPVRPEVAGPDLELPAVDASPVEALLEVVDRIGEQLAPVAAAGLVAEPVVGMAAPVMATVDGLTEMAGSMAGLTVDAIGTLAPLAPAPSIVEATLPIAEVATPLVRAAANVVDGPVAEPTPPPAAVTDPTGPTGPTGPTAVPSATPGTTGTSGAIGTPGAPAASAALDDVAAPVAEALVTLADVSQPVSDAAAAVVEQAAAEVEAPPMADVAIVIGDVVDAVVEQAAPAPRAPSPVPPVVDPVSTPKTATAEPARTTTTNPPPPAASGLDAVQLTDTVKVPAAPVKAPEIKVPKPVRAPEPVDIAVEPVRAPLPKAPEVKAPEVTAPEAKAPEVKVPEVKAPEVEVPAAAVSVAPVAAPAALR